MSTSIETALKKRYHYEIKDNTTFELIDSRLFEDGALAYKLEQQIIKEHDDKLINREDMILLSGFTETFTEDVLNSTLK